MSKWCEDVTNQVIDKFADSQRVISDLYLDNNLYIKLFYVAQEQNQTITEYLASKGYTYKMYTKEMGLVERLHRWVKQLNGEVITITAIRSDTRFKGYGEVIKSIANDMGVHTSMVYQEIGIELGSVRKYLSEHDVIEWIRADYGEGNFYELNNLPKMVIATLTTMGYDSHRKRLGYLKEKGLYSEAESLLPLARVIDELLQLYPHRNLRNLEVENYRLYKLLHYYADKACTMYPKFVALWGFKLSKSKRIENLSDVYNELSKLYPNKKIYNLAELPSTIHTYLKTIESSTGTSVESLLKLAGFKLNQ